MSGINPNLQTTDLPLAWAIENHPYNDRFVELIGLINSKKIPNQKELKVFSTLREQIWFDIDSLKKAKGDSYFSYLAKRLGIAVDEHRQLIYSWQQKDYDRIGRESQYYGVDPNTRKLVPVELNFDRPCVIVFPTGRAFSKMDPRSRHLNESQIMQRARQIMGIQCHMVQSRLAPQAKVDGVQIAAIALDMVDNEVERFAMRAQYGLDYKLIPPVSKRLGERVFGARIAEAEFTSDGTFVRNGGKINGKRLADDEILHNLSNMILVGGSIGNLLAMQSVYYLEMLLRELGVSNRVIKQALGRLLFIGLLPTNQLIPPPGLNYLAISNRFDEFSIITVDLESLYAKAKTAGYCLLPDGALLENNNLKSFRIIFEGQSTIYHSCDKYEFAYDACFFGHNVKIALNELKKRGFDKVVRRILKTQDAFNLGQMIEEAIQNNELVLEL